MAKLTIGNQTVTVDDSFLIMSPADQQKAVEEISASLGSQPQPQPSTGVAVAPEGLKPGTREYAQWAAQQARAGNKLPQISNPNPQPTVQPGSPDILGSTAATLGGIVNGIPVIGPAAQYASDAIVGAGSALTGGDYGQTVKGLQDRRAQLAQNNPVASVAGNVAGALGAFGAGGLTATGANALGLTGSTGARVGNSLLSTAGLTTADNIVRGMKPTDALAEAVIPSLASAAVPVVGAGIRKGTESAANAINRARQAAVTDPLIASAPTASQIRNSASQLFEASTGGTPLAISDNAYFRFLGGVKQYADKLRINPENDPQATGLLSTLMRIADDTSQGVAVDLKDLHLVRQLANKVSASPNGRDAGLGRTVVRQLDELISGLKPADILGGADPSRASEDLLRGIATWSRASKVGIIEEAITQAQTYKSGFENGLRLQFQKLLRNPETRKLFTQAEREAIETVGNGTTMANIVTLLGKFGFGANGAQNMLGGSIGASLGATAGSVLGPLGSMAGAGLAAGAGSAMRGLSEKLGSNAADRALRIVATPGIPQASQIAIPQGLYNALGNAEIAGRSLALGL